MGDPNRQSVVSRIRIPASVLASIDKASKQLEANPDLTIKERQFLQAALELAHEYYTRGKDPSFDYRTFKARLMRWDMPLRDNSIRERLSQLSHKGFFQNLELPVDRSTPARKPREFRLEQIHLDEFRSANQQELESKMGGRQSQRSSNPREILAHLRDSDAQLAAFNENTKRRNDNLWTGLADRVMRFSRREKPSENRIETVINMFDTPLLLQMTTQTGVSSEIATLQDQRVIRAIISQIAHLIETKKEQWVRERASHLLASSTLDELGNELAPELSEDDITDLEHYIENSFYIDVTRIAGMLGYSRPSSGSARRHINQAIRRLYESNFRVTIQSNDPASVRKIMDMYGLDDVAADFRFISDLKSQYSAEFYPQEPATGSKELTEKSIEQALDPYQNGDFERVRVWQISIDSHLYRKLIRDTRSALFTAHEEILRENSGLAQCLYNWISHIIGRTDPKITGQERICNQTLETIQRTLWPWRKYSKFEENVAHIIRQHSAEGEFDETLDNNKVRMWGYYWTLYRHKDTRKLMLRVERDPEDPITGDKSFHNNQLRHQKARTSGNGWTPKKQGSLPGV